MSLNSINLGLSELLRDPDRRREFFKAITRDEVASQIRDLRKKRNLNQTAFAQLADMKQSAVSRIEQAEYSSWTLTTLLRVADALDARWRIILEPAEDAIRQYEAIDSPVESYQIVVAESSVPADAIAFDGDNVTDLKTSHEVLTERRRAIFKPITQGIEIS